MKDRIEPDKNKEYETSRHPSPTDHIISLAVLIDLWSIWAHGNYSGFCSIIEQISSFGFKDNKKK